MATKTFNLSLPEELVTKIDAIARSNYMSRSELIKHALIKELKSDSAQWQTVVDFTKINKNGVDAQDILSALKAKMADKIKKALAKLSAKEKEVVAALLVKIIANDVQGLDIKQLKGNDNIYRVRKGNIRIIFTKYNNDVTVLTIARRNEKTYKDF